MEVVKKKKKGRPKTIYRKVGRKPKLTIDLIIKLANLVGKGVPIQTCCQALNISETAYYKWVQRAGDILEQQEESDDEIAINSEDELFLQLVESVKVAEAQWEIDTLAQIDLHIKRTWEAGKWRLTRKKPELYGDKPQEVTLDDKTNKAVEETLKLLKGRAIEDVDSNE